MLHVDSNDCAIVLSVYSRSLFRLLPGSTMACRIENGTFCWDRTEDNSVLRKWENSYLLLLSIVLIDNESDERKRETDEAAAI